MNSVFSLKGTVCFQVWFFGTTVKTYIFWKALLLTKAIKENLINACSGVITLRPQKSWENILWCLIFSLKNLCCWVSNADMTDQEKSLREDLHQLISSYKVLSNLCKKEPRSSKVKTCIKNWKKGFRDVEPKVEALKLKKSELWIRGNANQDIRIREYYFEWNKLQRRWSKRNWTWSGNHSLQWSTKDPATSNTSIFKH